MKTWTDIGSDVNWEEYGGKWAKADPTYSGRYYVIEFINMDESCGRDNEGHDKYLCEVKQVDLTEVPRSELESALESCGMDLEEIAFEVRQGSTPPAWAMVEACHGYGISAPMECFGSNTYATRLRAQARRYAESLMADEALVQSQLSKPVNKIGSTARDFGRGDVMAGLKRYQDGKGGQSDTSDLMLKIYGATPRE